MRGKQWIELIQEVPPIWKLSELGSSEFNKMKSSKQLSGFKIPKRTLRSTEDNGVMSTSPTSCPSPKQKKISHNDSNSGILAPNFNKAKGMSMSSLIL